MAQVGGMQALTVLTSLDAQSSGEPQTSSVAQAVPSSVQSLSTLPSHAVTPASQIFSGSAAASAPGGLGKLGSSTVTT
jgi:hypothetical protein